jgi:hypothetical protein
LIIARGVVMLTIDQVAKTEKLRSHNNFVYLFHFKESFPEDLTIKRGIAKPGTSAVPKGTSRLICRMSSFDANLNDEFRVQDQVAIMNLAQSAFASFLKRILPLIFDWEDTTPSSSGWMINERRYDE